tara:strand:+ start:542 stop:778 length:237 start_codon:yes stop_codon:yes gene_type:complete
MSGYVSKRVSNTRTAMGTTDQRPAGSGSVMLGLASTIGRRRPLMRLIQRKTYSSMRQKKCAQGELGECSTFTIKISGN